MSDFDGSLGQVIKGTIRVATTSDDDFMGFIFGLDCSPPAPAIVTSCAGPGVLLDWKQGAQSGAAAGTAVSQFTAWGTADPFDFWPKQNTVTELARGNNFGATGWGDNVSYDFVAAYTRTRLTVFINGLLEFDVTGTFPLGRNGFYGYSQSNTVYSDIEIIEAVGTHQCSAAPVSYTYDFNHSGGCTSDRFSLEVIWDTLDATEGTTIYPSPDTFDGTTGTFDLSNIYNNAGPHNFRMQLRNNGANQGAPVDEFALVRDPVDAEISMTPNAFCGASSRCDAPTAEVFFSRSEGGAPGYTALWSDGDTTCCTGGVCSACDTSRFVGAGTYSATVTDSQGCFDTTSTVTVTESSVDSVTFSEPSCGNLNTNVVGDCTTFTYAWSTVDGCSSCLTPGASSQSGLEPGTYDLTVTDQNGCSRSVSYTTSYGITSPATEDEIVYMYVPRTWSWTGFQGGSTGDVVLEHTVTGRRVTLFSGDLSTTTSVEYGVFMFEPGYVMFKYEASGAASCVVQRRFYLCASDNTNDPMCDEH